MQASNIGKDWPIKTNLTLERKVFLIKNFVKRALVTIRKINFARSSETVLFRRNLHQHHHSISKDPKPMLEIYFNRHWYAFYWGKVKELI